MTPPRISALFSTFNRAALLREALTSLQCQTLPHDQFEIIVIDDGSVDATRQVVAGFEGALPIRYAYQSNRGLAEGKNHAVRLATGPLVVFMDDDDIASPDLLEQHLAAHTAHPDERMAVLGYTDLRSDFAASPLMRYVTEVGFQLFCYPQITSGQILDYRYFWGGRSSCKRSLLLRYGLFDPIFKFGCEDTELGYRLSKYGLRVVYDKRVKSTMIREMTLQNFCGRVELQGRSSWIFSRKHPTPEVETLLRVNDIDKRWSTCGPLLHRARKSANGLEKIVKARVDHGIAPDAALFSLLHKAYQIVLNAYRVKGAWEARKEAAYESDLGCEKSSTANVARELHA